MCVGADGARKTSWVRAAVASLEAVFFAALAHACAGGGLLGLGTVLQLAGVVALVSVGLRLRILRLPVAAALAVGSQLGVHQLAGIPDAVPSTGHHMHAAVAPAGGLDEQMLLAHALSAVVTVLALVWQEQMVVRVVRLLLPETVQLVPRRGPDCSIAAVEAPTAAQEALLSTCPWRGPPVLRPAA